MNAPQVFRRPESVLVVVYSRDGYALLLERKTPFVFRQSVTGSLEAGESAAAAARRELREETGLVDEGEWFATGVSRQFAIDPRWLSRYAPGVRENVEYEWHYVVERRCGVRLDPAEHGCFEWLPLSQAAATVWSWTNQDALRNLLLVTSVMRTHDSGH